MIARELVALPGYAEEVAEGLMSVPKRLPSKLLYDEHGSRLFEEITRLPEYYLTRTELEILEAESLDVARALDAPVSVVELGAGTATKTGTLLRAFLARQMRLHYFPVDISSSALADAQSRICRDCPTAVVHPIVADFSCGFGFLEDISGRKLVLYLGSSIGNFDGPEARALLEKVRARLSPADAFLLGTDMVKGPEILLPAYDDAQGITAAFNKNILRRLNRELGANFDLARFRHVAEWNPRSSRMEIYLESTRRQGVRLGLMPGVIRLDEAERIHTENSYKYTPEMVAGMLAQAGWRLEQSWFDRRRWFGLHLARF
jgi:dimethylhistidine N-methyltransferase